MARIEGELDRRFAQVETRFAQVDTRFATLEGQIARTLDAVKALSERMESHFRITYWILGTLAAALVGLAWRLLHEETPMPPNTDLYVTDFYTWCLEQAALLEARDADALDWTHLAEEMQVLAGSERRALRSFVRGLLLHLLKWQYQPEMRCTGHSWERSITNGRRDVRDLLRDAPGLHHVLDDTLLTAYEYARDDAADETHLPLATFPETCPWTLAQILAHDFWPEP